MKWLMLFIVLGFSGQADAAQGLLIPMVTPAPHYPEQLVKSRYTGKVRVLLSIKSDGLVSEAKAIESSHPVLTAAVEETLIQWRFKPWMGTVGAPPLIAVTLPVIFGSQGAVRFDDRVNVGLGNIQCAYVNHEVETHQRDFSRAPLSKVDVFWYTGQFLHSSYAALQLDDEKRQVLLGQLEDAIPRVVTGCKASPQRTYGDFLPAPIRAMLVGVAESDELRGAF